MKTIFKYTFNILLLICCSTNFLWALTSGPNNPSGVYTDNYDNTYWANTGNGYTQNNSYISIGDNDFDNGNYSDGIWFYGFGFAIPGTATITGITVEVDYYRTSGNVYDGWVRLTDRNWNSVGTNKASWSLLPNSDTDTYKTFGGTADTWAAGLTVTDINDPDFGVGMYLYSTSNNAQARIDHVRITVTYTVPGPACNPCYSITNGNINSAATWSATSGGSAVGSVPANDGTVSFIVEGNDVVNMNVDYSIRSMTVRGNSNLRYTAANVQLDINGAGSTISIESGSQIDENGQTNADIVFKSGNNTYGLVVADATNGLDIDNIFIEDNCTVNISGAGIIDVDADIMFIGDNANVNNNSTGTFTVRDDIQFGDAAGDDNNNFNNNGTIAVLGDLYVITASLRDTVVNTGTLNITGDIMWPDDGGSDVHNTDIINNGTITVGDDINFGSDDNTIHNNGTLTVNDEIRYYQHADRSGLTTGAGSTTLVFNRIYFEADANAGTANYIINAGTFTITTNDIESYQGGVIITNLSTGNFTIADDIYHDNSNNAMLITNSGILTITDDLRLQDNASTMTVVNNSGGVLNFADVEGSDGDLDITNSGTINQTGTFLNGEIDNSSTFINSTNARWNYGGTGHDPDVSMNCTANGNIFNYNRAGNQSMIDVVTDDYHHLEITTSGTKTSADNMDIEGNLTISGTAIFNVATGNDDITIAGNWINTSTLGFTEGNRSVTFDGTGGASAQAITCSTIGTETFHNLNINKNTGGVVTLNNHVSLTNTGILNFNGTNGYIALNSRNLTIPAWTAGDITGYDSNEFIIVDQTGFIKFTGVDNGEVLNIPIGLSAGTTNYALADLTMTNAGSGTLDANLCDYVSNTGTCIGGTEILSDVVDYTWNFVSTSNNAVVKLQWHNSKEMAGFDPNLSSVAHYSSGAWVDLTAFAAATNEGSGFYSRTGTTTGFSPYTVEDGDSPLPIELTKFAGKVINSKNVISWVTSTEVNNNYFVLEKSFDGVSFEKIARIEGAGNSQSQKNYEYLDSETSTAATYYRLTQVDYDGKNTTYPIIAVNGTDEQSKENSFKAILYPNPVDKGGIVKVKFNEDISFSDILIVVIDVIGNQHYLKAEFICCDSYALNTEHLSAGVYYIVASQKEVLVTNKLVVQ